MDIFNINVIDAIIVLLILCCGVVGMKRGVFKELVMTIGYLILIVLSLIIKNPIAEFLSLHLPFFDFWGDLKGLEVLNILFYQIISFILVMAALSIIFNIILKVTKFIEKVLNATIILGLVSKILGLIVGLIEGYILMFIFCVFISCPGLDQTVTSGSKLKPRILNSTPILSDVSKSMTGTINELAVLTESVSISDKDEFNRQTINIMLKHELISVDYVNKLIEKGKLKTPGLNEIVARY